MRIFPIFRADSHHSRLITCELDRSTPSKTIKSKRTVQPQLLNDEGRIVLEDHAATSCLSGVAIRLTPYLGGIHLGLVLRL